MRQPAAWRAWAIAAAAAVALVACGTTPPPAFVEPHAAVGDETPPAMPAPPADPEPRLSVLAEADRLAAAPPAVPPPLPAAALPGPERLVGVTAAELAALLGEPGFVRRDPPAEIWQYAVEACVLDVFLYQPAAGGPSRVEHLDFRGRTVAGVAPAECYRQLLAARAARPSG